MFPEKQVGDAALQILVDSERHRGEMEAAAARRGIAFAQLLAAAIAGALRECCEGADEPSCRAPGDGHGRRASPGAASKRRRS